MQDNPLASSSQPRKHYTSLEGVYDVSGSVYTRATDKHQLVKLPSTRKNGADYLEDRTAGRRFLSSVWDDNPHPEFDDREYRYRIRPTGNNRVVIEILRRADRRRRRASA